MSKIVVFGAGGRAGRKVVAEAVRRGHLATAVVRDPTRYAELAGPSITVVGGDVVDAAAVATLSVGHAAAVSAAARLDLPATEFYSAATRALISGLTEAGVARLVLVGIGTTLITPAGTPLHDSAGFPPEGRAFSLGHSAELDILQADGTELDWLVLAPPPVVLAEGDEFAEELVRTGGYRLGDSRLISDAGPTFSYAELATAILDEIDNPQRSRELVAVAY